MNESEIKKNMIDVRAWLTNYGFKENEIGDLAKKIGSNVEFLNEIENQYFYCTAEKLRVEIKKAIKGVK